MQIVGGAAHRSMTNFKGQLERAQHANRLFDNFGADSVAWQYCNFLRHVVLIQK